MKIKKGLSSITSNVSEGGLSTTLEYNVGKVYLTIGDKENTPSSIWNKFGKEEGIGTVLYGPARESEDIDLSKINDEFLDSLPYAIPFFPNILNYPIPGELILLIKTPAPSPDVINSLEQTYYLGPINTWNNYNFNPSFKDNDKQSLYPYFSELTKISVINKKISDICYSGRWGNYIKFSDNKQNPLTIISNSTDEIEQGNSIILSQNSKIKISNPVKYLSSLSDSHPIDIYDDDQIILNSKRILLNAYKDKILLLSNNGVEISSNKEIILRSGNSGVVIQDDKVFMGPSTSEDTQPIALGNDLKETISSVLLSLSNFASSISNAISTPEGSPITVVVSAAETLQTSLEKIMEDIEKDNYITSNKVFSQ